MKKITMFIALFAGAAVLPLSGCGHKEQVIEATPEGDTGADTTEMSEEDYDKAMNEQLSKQQ